MAIPVINTSTSILNWQVGETVSHQFAATESPTSWDLVGEPAGLTISSGGLLSGTIAGAAAVYSVIVQATNIDGTGELIVTIPIRPADVVPDSGMTLPIDIDLRSHKVTVYGIPEDLNYGPPILKQRETGRARPLMPIFNGQRHKLSIGLTSGDAGYQDVVLNSIDFTAKNFEDEAGVALLSGLEKIESGPHPRWETTFYVGPGVAAILQDYSSPLGTFADLFAQFDVRILNDGNEYDKTEVEALSPSITAGTSQTDTLVFTGLPEAASATRYTFTLDLNLTSKATQDVTLTITADIAYNTITGLFEVSNQSGTTSGQGADEAPGHWRSTFELLSITGTAAGVDVEVKTTASEGFDILTIPALSGSGDWTIVSGAIQFGGAGPENFTATDTGAANSEIWSLDDGDDEADILAKVNALPAPFASEVDTVAFEGQNIVFYFVDGADTVRYSGAASGDFDKVDGSSAQAGNHTVQLVGNAEDDVYLVPSEKVILRAETRLGE